jgi:hypothetical protein
MAVDEPLWGIARQSRDGEQQHLTAWAEGLYR